jgi:hypothetical protein
MSNKTKFWSLQDRIICKDEGLNERRHWKRFVKKLNA